MADKIENSYNDFKSRIPEEARQHFRTAREELRKSMAGMLPTGFMEHRRQARKEMLLAWRSMIDARLEHLEGKK